MTKTELDHYRAIIGEKFNSYVLIVEKDGQVASCFSSKCTALGMTKMVHDDIEYEMQLNREDMFAQEDLEDNQEE